MTVLYYDFFAEKQVYIPTRGNKCERGQSTAVPVGAISIALPAVRRSTEELERRALALTMVAAMNIGRALQASGSVNSSL